jgi:hypothetical protein
MNLDVVAGAGDVPNDAGERKAAQIAVPEPREVTGMHVEPRRSNVALPSMENRTQLGGELRFEVLLGTGAFHAPRIARACRVRRIELLRQSPFRWCPRSTRMVLSDPCVTLLPYRDTKLRNARVVQ